MGDVGRGDERGLCDQCAHARVQRGKRASEFLRCARADGDPGYLRYPPLPVMECEGFEVREPDRRSGSPRGSEGQES